MRRSWLPAAVMTAAFILGVGALRAQEQPIADDSQCVSTAIFDVTEVGVTPEVALVRFAAAMAKDATDACRAGTGDAFGRGRCGRSGRRKPSRCSCVPSSRQRRERFGRGHRPTRGRWMAC